MANLIKDEVDLLFVAVATLYNFFLSLLVLSGFSVQLAGKGNILEVIRNLKLRSVRDCAARDNTFEK